MLSEELVPLVFIILELEWLIHSSNIARSYLFKARFEGFICLGGRKERKEDKSRREIWLLFTFPFVNPTTEDLGT